MPIWLLATTNVTWYLLPLAMVVSLVYSASRFERTEKILRRGFRLFLQILSLMFAVLALLWLFSLNL